MSFSAKWLNEKGFKEYEPNKFARGVKEITKVETKHRPLKLPKLDPFLKLCEIEIGIVPVTEHRFHPVRGWRFDYAFVDLKISVEKEGGIRRPGGGAHSRPANIERDIEKYSEAAVMGWIVIRRTPQKLCTEETISLIKKAMQYGVR